MRPQDTTRPALRPDPQYRDGRAAAYADMQQCMSRATRKAWLRAHSQRPWYRDTYIQGYVDAVAERVLDGMAPTEKGETKNEI